MGNAMGNGYLLAALFTLSAFSNACHQSLSARNSAELKDRKMSVTYTTVVRLEDELPRCDLGTEGLKAYVSEKDGFVQCHANSWGLVNPGDVSMRFKAREPVRYHEWFDVKAKRRWLAAITDERVANLPSERSCQAGWKLPNESELATASRNGLFDGIKAHGGIAFDKAWTESASIVRGISQGELETETPARGAPSTAGIYCVLSEFAKS
jgi:hypothetical protein